MHVGLLPSDTRHAVRRESGEEAGIWRTRRKGRKDKEAEGREVKGVAE